MRCRLLVLTIIVSFSVGVPVHAADDLPVRAADDLIVSGFSDYLDALRIQAGIPGLAVALIKSGDPDWEVGLGQADVEHALPARLDTPFELDGLTQVFTAEVVLHCVEEGRLSLDDPIGLYAPGSSDPNATIRQLLSHTSGPPDHLVFSYDLGRLNSLAGAVAACSGMTYRATIADLLDRLAMVNSVVGLDVLSLAPPYEGMTQTEMSRYASDISQLARPYAVDSGGKATLSRYTATTLTPGGGLISAALDLARLDTALRQGVVIGLDTLNQAWTAPVDANGQPLPHGLGWFVQTYNGERIVWQYGLSGNASSSMMITIPGRGITLVLLANSQGLAGPFSLSAGDVTVSPFARLFLSLYMR